MIKIDPILHRSRDVGRRLGQHKLSRNTAQHAWKCAKNIATIMPTRAQSCATLCMSSSGLPIALAIGAYEASVVRITPQGHVGIAGRLDRRSQRALAGSRARVRCARSARDGGMPRAARRGADPLTALVTRHQSARASSPVLGLFFGDV
jgi:hypothetical protein